VRWLLSQRRSRGRLPSLGQDFGEGHRRYVERLHPSAEEWLRTKPFSVPPRDELLACLRVFAHVVDRLELDVRAQVLDVGCGPGWMSEFLARCGYWVTGVDVSEDMVRIARERIAAIDEPVGGGFEALAEFHAMPVRELPWTARFDAAVLYDTMHHFDEELETLRVIRRTLVPGGRIFIHEGVRPERGSEGERLLIAEMEEYGTLESPFDPDYLVEIVREAGFTDVSRFAAVDELLDLSSASAELRQLERRLKSPTTNTLVARNPDAGTRGFAAQLEPQGSWRQEGTELLRTIKIGNVGDRFWPAESGSAVPHGVVTVGPYVPLPDGGRKELPRLALPRPLSPGDEASVEVRLARADLAGEREIAVDLVREGIAWFGDYGSTPLVLAVED
jgi:SAM-dependent methyltransferase